MCLGAGLSSYSALLSPVPLIGLASPPANWRRVRYVTIARLVNEVVEAADERVLPRVVGRHGRLDLFCLDELGYAQIDPGGAELLFQGNHRPARKRLQFRTATPQPGSSEPEV